MGVSASAPLWADPNMPADNDMWGFLPPGMTTAPQHNVSELYVEGFPPVGNGLNGSTPLWVGQRNDRLESFGKASWLTNDTILNSLFTKAGTQLTRFHQFYRIEAPIDWSPTAGIECDPSIYPHCDFSVMRAQQPTLTQYDKTWGSTSQAYYCPSYKGSGTLYGCGGIDDNGVEVVGAKEPFNQMDLWLESIDRNSESYKTGAFEALKETNQDDTSAYDPCDSPSLLNAVFPTVFAIAGAIGVRYLFQDVLDQLGPATETAVYTGVVGTMYAMGEVAAESTPIFGDADERKAKLVQASSILSVTTGIVTGLLIYDNSDVDESLQYVFPICGGLVGYQLLQSLVLSILTGAATGFYVALLPNIVFAAISKLWCKLTTGGMTACNDYSKHPTARRWDVASLAARMTDMACEAEGWDRSSPQAEFVFRSLVTNPFFMDAANVTPGQNTLYDIRPVNPAGVIAPLHESGYTANHYSYTNKNHQVYNQWWSPPDMWSFTGNSSEQTGYTGTAADHNFFACQNFDILWNADECTADGNVGNGGGQLNCAEKYHPDGSDKILAQKLKFWLASAIENSYNPANIAKQSQIKGLSSSSYQPPSSIQPIATYLATCFRDFDSKNGTGFDTIEDRANYAALYKPTEMTRAQYLLIQADHFLQFPSLEAAWTAAQKLYDKRNLTAWAHYANKKRGTLQEDSFKLWQGGYKEVEEWAATHFNEGFADTPLTNLTPFLTPIGAPVNDPPTLQPIGAPLPLQPILDPLAPPTTMIPTLVRTYNAVVDLIVQGPTQANVNSLNQLAELSQYPHGYDWTRPYTGTNRGELQYIGTCIFAFSWAKQPDLNIFGTASVIQMIEQTVKQSSYDIQDQDDMLYGAGTAALNQKWFVDACMPSQVAILQQWGKNES